MTIPATYWLNEKVIRGSNGPLDDAEILIVGSGLAGVSAAYWLLREGFEDIVIIDDEPDQGATFRNCGHILYGTVESMHAMVAIHGKEIAEELLRFSVEVCHEVRDTVARLDVDVEYKQNGYLVIAIDEAELDEISSSVRYLQDCGVENRMVDSDELRALGFQQVLGGRFESGSAQAHPAKFRNRILEYVLKRGVRYHSGIKLSSLSEVGEKVLACSTSGEKSTFEAGIIAANAYSPLFSDFFKSRRLIEPFRGQIIVSRPLHDKLVFAAPHSFDHGYEYAIGTSDNRLMIGGWRKHVPGREMGSYDLASNPAIDTGLKDFVARHYSIEETIEWEYSWAGIMGSSLSGLPFIGPTDSQRIYACAGFNGHGFSWAHGSAKLLAEIMAGKQVPKVSRFFDPRRLAN